MKIMIVGDSHFGSSYHLGKEDPDKKVNSRLIDYYNTLNYVIDRAIEERVSCFCFTGDLFRDTNPSKSQLNFFSRCLMRLVKARIQTIIVVGNHDQSIQLISDSAASIFGTLEIDGVQVMDQVGTCTFPADKGKTPLSVIGLPYRNLQMLGVFDHSEAVKIVRAKLDLTIQALNDRYGPHPIIVIGHYLVEGVQRFGMELTGMEKELVLPVDMFNNCFATIMGHVHNAQLISQSPYVYFVGSLDRVDLGEANDTKSVAVLDIDVEKYKDVPMGINLLPVPSRPLYHIKIDLLGQNGTPDEMIRYIHGVVQGYLDLVNAIVKVTVTVPDEIGQFITVESVKESIAQLPIYYLHSVNVIRHKRKYAGQVSEGMSPIAALECLVKDIENEEHRTAIKKRALEIMGYREGNATS